MQDILLGFLMFLIKMLSSIFITPIVSLVSAFIPDISTFITTCRGFLSTYVFPGALFAKQVFVNCTGVSQTVLTALFTYLALKITLWVSMQVYKLVIKVWKLVKP